MTVNSETFSIAESKFFAFPVGSGLAVLDREVSLVTASVGPAIVVVLEVVVTVVIGFVVGLVEVYVSVLAVVAVKGLVSAVVVTTGLIVVVLVAGVVVVVLVKGLAVVLLVGLIVVSGDPVFVASVVEGELTPMSAYKIWPVSCRFSLELGVFLT